MVRPWRRAQGILERKLGSVRLVCPRAFSIPEPSYVKRFGSSFGRKKPKEGQMSLLKWALIMLVVSIVAALLGFTGLSAASADVARILFYVFIVIFLVLLILGLMGRRGTA
jgi:uncharacterized membrane protein YtjA (UPF0391 family)